ncbi:MAG TPA: hypothetical protein IAB11_01620 [Candidatus Ornithoclostridium faecavium]|nr:hypothetical protein [Candidatus Ornithoclostridium faecavium]
MQKDKKKTCTIALKQELKIAEVTDENPFRKSFEREGLRVNEKSLGGNNIAHIKLHKMLPEKIGANVSENECFAKRQEKDPL